MGMILNLCGEYQYTPFPSAQRDLKPVYHSLTKARIILSKYKAVGELGNGTYGKVYKLERDDQFFALKMISKATIEKSRIESIFNEKKVMMESNSPFVVKLFQCFQDDCYLYFVMEFCPGGQLTGHIAKLGRFSEEQAKFYAAEILIALDHLHQKGIMHRDLKSENIVLDEKGHIKLIDFGSSKIGKKKADSKIGTLCYLAPEILEEKSYDFRVDFWELGCVLYEMLHGYTPFEDSSETKILIRIKSGRMKKIDSRLSQSAKKLIIGLLQVKPDLRLGRKGIEEIKGESFFEGVDWKKMEEKAVEPPIKIEKVESISEVKTAEDLGSIRVVPMQFHIDNFSVSERVEHTRLV